MYHRTEAVYVGSYVGHGVAASNSAEFITAISIWHGIVIETCID
jgi:hypothetical protein